MDSDATALSSAMPRRSLNDETSPGLSTPKGMYVRSNRVYRPTKWCLTIDPYIPWHLEMLAARLNNLTCVYVHVWVSPPVSGSGPDHLCQCHNLVLSKCHSPLTTIHGYFETKVSMGIEDVKTLIGIPCTLYPVAKKDKDTNRGVLTCVGKHVFNECAGVRYVNIYPDGVTVVSRLQEDGRRIFVKSNHWASLYRHLQPIPELDSFYSTYRRLQEPNTC